MSLRNLIQITGLSPNQFAFVLRNITLPAARRRRPNSTSIARRVALVLIWLRTSLTEKALAALFGISQPTTHRIIRSVLPLISEQHDNTIPDGKEHLLLDGTLIPVQDNSITKKSKNYRKSINTQIVCSHKRQVIFVSPVWPGNRNDIIVARQTVPTGRTFLTDGAYRTFPGAIIPPPRTEPKTRRRHIQVRARAEHTIARMKDWAILRWCRSRGGAINHALQATAYLHNIRMGHIKTEL